MPSLQWNVVWWGDWDAHLAVAAPYGPVESLLFSPNSLIGVVSIGVERWAHEIGGVGLFVGGRVEVGYQLLGESEGSGEERAPFLAPKLQLGLLF